MKALTNASPKTVAQALTVIRDARTSGRAVAVAGGGSDLLGMIKDRLVAPDVLVRLKTIGGLDQIAIDKAAVTIGGQITLDALSRHASLAAPAGPYAVLAEAARDVATPQIRNVATLAGNVCQRPWCWYYRNGFKCFKAGGNTCFSANGENEFHAIFGGGPSYIVHPSDTAAALVALDATFVLAGPSGRRRVKATDFFTLPTVNAARENVLADGEILESIALPVASSGVRSTYQKIMDREAWTHAVVSVAAVIEGDRDRTVRRARIVLGGVAPIPWRLTEVEQWLVGKAITAEVAAQAGERAIAGARPLAKNAYKVPLTKNLVARTIETLGRSA